MQISYFTKYTSFQLQNFISQSNIQFNAHYDLNTLKIFQKY